MVTLPLWQEDPLPSGLSSTNSGPLSPSPLLSLGLPLTPRLWTSLDAA